jgi:hypothetical protein
MYIAVHVQVTIINNALQVYVSTACVHSDVVPKTYHKVRDCVGACHSVLAQRINSEIKQTQTLFS